MPASRQTPLRIALADDDADMRALLTRMLQRLGCEVCCSVGDGGELLAQSRAGAFDLALVDLDMPGVDGLEAAEGLALLSIPVILVSGHPDAHRVAVDKEPIARRLSKPVTLETLRAAIAAAIGARGA